MIRHTGIVVDNIEESIDFYTSNFNLVVKSNMLEQGQYIDAMLGIADVKVRTVKLSDTKGGLIELLKFENLTQVFEGSFWRLADFGCSHVAFTVPDVELCHRQMADSGCINVSDPQTPPGNKVKVFFSQTPKKFGGVFIEIVQEL